MKRKHQKPEIIGVFASTGQEILAGSYIPIGGNGTFDVKDGNVFDDDDQKPRSFNV